MISKYHGDIEDLRIVPLTPVQIVWAMSIASLLRGLIVGLTVFLTGELFSYLQTGVLYSVDHPLWMGYFLIIGGLAFGQIGLVVGFTAKTFDHMNAFSSFILLPLIYLGGVFFSLQNLHPFWQTASLGNPLLYYINGVRYAMISVSDIPVTSCAIIGLLFLCFSTVAAYVAVRRGNFQRF
jgi:ABC-2 type transport system permease protein